jgi:hypothetical protein
VELYACCARPAESRCGLVTGTVCEELGQRGEIDPSCPTLPDTVIGTLPGCCRPEGMCGVFDTAYGFGCGQVPVISQLSPCTPKP